MPKPKRLKYKELIKRLEKYDIIVIKKRGKGSHRMLYQESTKLNYPIKCHNENQEYSIGTLKAIQRRFSLPDEFLY
jgi:predicted RNA binding protein YcfA (HicA-like mRNA interferase family)